MKRVVVTGGNGFLGAGVCDELTKRGFTAERFDRPDNDIRDRKAVMDFVVEAYAVVHMAGVLGTHELFDTVDLAIDVNIKGTVNVLDACREARTRYVGITMPQVFPSVYAATKMAATRMASAYHQAYAIPVSHVRAFNAFGPGQKYGAGHPQKIVPTFAVSLLRDEPIPIWGNGHQTVDLIHHSALARMLVDAMDYGDDTMFDGGTGVAFSVLDVARMIADIVGVEPRFNFQPMRRGERPTKLVARGDDWQHLGWCPEFRRDDLENTVEWYREQYGVSYRQPRGAAKP